MSKILCLSHIFPPAIDGGSRVIYKIGQYFESCGNEVLYLSSDCSSTDDFTKQTPLSFRHLPLKKGRHFFPSIHQGRGPGGGFRLPVYHSLRRPLKFINLFLPKNSYPHQLLQIAQKGPIFRFFPFIKTTIKILKFKPDLIIAGPLPTTIILYAKFLKFLSRALVNQQTRLLVNSSFHPTDPDFHRLPLIKTLQSADYLWTLTQFETDYFIQNFKIDPHKIILAGNGVDESFLKKSTKIQRTRAPAHQRTKILFIGSLSAHKGLNVLIDSFPRLVKEGVRGRLIIAGQKTLHYPQIKKQISSLPKNIQSKIKFIFKFPQNKLAKLIDNCDVLVLPSKQESFGLVLIEAWARQKPVIVSNIPSLSELVTLSQGGLIFDLDKPIDLTKKINQLFQNPKLYYLLCQNGFNYVKNNYTWFTVGRKIQHKLSL